MSKENNPLINLSFITLDENKKNWIPERKGNTNKKDCEISWVRKFQYMDDNLEDGYPSEYYFG